MKTVKDFNPDSITDKVKFTKIKTDLSDLTKNQIKVINLLIRCAKILDDIFYLQKFPESLKLREKIEKKDDKRLIEYFRVMSGPFDHFNGNKPFIEGLEISDKAGFYPDDLTKSEWEQFIKKKPEKKDDFISPYTVITREEKKLTSVPYCSYYHDYLKKAADIMQKASEFADNYTLKSYLSAQANAFLTNDYNEADIRWLQLVDNDIVPLLGFYEFYEDRFFGYKACASAFIGIKNKASFKKLDLFKSILGELQARLPIPEHYRKQKRGSISQIEVIDLIFNSGDARSPIPAAAFNLPNSQKIRSEFGSKKVLLFNIIKEKFDSVMLPISKCILDEVDYGKITFDAYFNYILLHEISHELGIGLVKDENGDMYEVSFFLKDLYTVIEEAKADVMGIFSLLFLIKKSFIPDSTFTEICITYLINLFRLLRYGKKNVYGLSSLVQFNFLRSEGAFIPTDTKNTVTIDLHKFEKSIEKLLTIILTLQGEGDYTKSKEFIKKYSVIDADLKKRITRISKFPIDIFPWFPQGAEKKPVFE